MAVTFEWDSNKAASNLRKHGVAFEEACTVFGDPLAAIFDDEEHSMDEPREIVIGHFNPSASVGCFLHAARGRLGSDHQCPESNEERKNGL